MAPADYSGDIDPTDKDRKILDAFIIAKIKQWEEVYDGVLWISYQQDFAKWKLEDFRRASQQRLGELINLLRCNGVFVDNTLEHLPARNLDITLHEPERIPWTQEYITEHLELGYNINSRQLNRQFKDIILEPRHHWQRGHMAHAKLETPISQPRMQTRSQYQQETPTPGVPQQPHFQPARRTDPMTPIMESPNPPPRLPQPLPFNIPSAGPATPFPPPPPSQPALPTRPEPSRATAGNDPGGPNYTHALVQLAKLYTDEMKYGGGEDSFDWKYQVFQDYCQRVSLPNTPEAHNLALPTMLKGQALDYYYAWKGTWQTYGRDPVQGIKDYFQGPEYRRAVQHKWNRTTFQTTIDANPGKSLSECLDIMINTFQTLYHGLEPELRTGTYFRTKLHDATRTHIACVQATARPSETVAGLTQDLRSSVSQYEDMHRPSASEQFVGSSNSLQPNTLFTDRRYYRQPSQQQRSPYRSYNRSPHRSPHRSTTPPPGSRGQQKKCYVCHKTNCWSTRHTQEERNTV